jgi:hypothetical protein
MPIPAVISDLSPIIGTGPSPNGGQPGGGENPSTFDDYLRAYGAFIAQLRAGSGFANSGAFRIPFFDASGNWASSADFVRDASGNVGIGTATALSPLHVFRATSSSVRIDTDSVASTTQLNFAVAGTNRWSLYRPSGSNDLRLFDNVNTIDVMTWQAGGNVGVGQTPAFASGGGVAVYTLGTPQIALRNEVSGSGATAGARLFYSGVNLTLENRESGFVAFSTLSNERMRIDASGHQINTPGSTTPPTLTVNGQLNITPTSNTNVRISFRGTDGVTRVANITLA